MTFESRLAQHLTSISLGFNRLNRSGSPVQSNPEKAVPCDHPSFNGLIPAGPGDQDPARSMGTWVVHETHHLRVCFAQLHQKIEADPDLTQIILTEPCGGYRLMQVF